MTDDIKIAEHCAAAAHALANGNLCELSIAEIMNLARHGLVEIGQITYGYRMTEKGERLARNYDQWRNLVKSCAEVAD